MEIYIELDLIFDNDFDVNEITRKTGMNPTDCKNRSETRFNPLTNKNNEGYWTLQSRVHNEYDVKIVIDEFIPLFVDHLSEIKAICDTNNGEVKFSIVPSFSSNKTPAIYFERDFLDIVHYLNASIEIDMYVD